LENCNEKEKSYIEKMKQKSQEDIKRQLGRLEGMKGESMKAELKRWLNQRLAILKELSAKVEEEL
jgi:hypothetical protein